MRLPTMNGFSGRMVLPLLVILSPWTLLYSLRRLNVRHYVTAGSWSFDMPIKDLPSAMGLNKTSSSSSNTNVVSIRTPFSNKFLQYRSNTRAKLKILVGIELLHRKHLSIVTKTFQGSGFQVQMYVNDKTYEDLSFSLAHPEVKALPLSSFEWKNLYVSMLAYNDAELPDWYLRCPSSTYISPVRLRSLLETLTLDIPLYLNFQLPNTTLQAPIDGRCELWNRRAAVILNQTITECESLSNEGAPRTYEDCANESQVERIDLGPLPTVDTPCNFSVDNATIWLYPHFFGENPFISSWARYLAVAYPGKFQHASSCACQVSPISHELQQCGDLPWQKSNCNNRPRCPFSMLDDENTDMVATRNIPAYVISLHINSTQQRIEQYLPSSIFRGHTIEGIRAKRGITGYRKSVGKALTTGLQKTNAPILALFDDDFRVTRDFEARWTEMTEPTSTCYHHSLSNNGFFLMGMTVHSSAYWQHILTHRTEYVHGSNKSTCTDGSSFMRGSFATLFSRKGAQLAVQWIENTPDDRPFDWFWMDIVELGYPVRGAIYPLFVADVNHTSLVDPTRKKNVLRTAHDRHNRHRWGHSSEYVP